MKIRELIEELRRFDQMAEVIVLDQESDAKYLITKIYKDEERVVIDTEFVDYDY